MLALMGLLSGTETSKVFFLKKEPKTFYHFTFFFTYF